MLATLSEIRNRLALAVDDNGSVSINIVFTLLFNHLLRCTGERLWSISVSVERKALTGKSFRYYLGLFKAVETWQKLNWRLVWRVCGPGTCPYLNCSGSTQVYDNTFMTFLYFVWTISFHNRGVRDKVMPEGGMPKLSYNYTSQDSWLWYVLIFEFL